MRIFGTLRQRYAVLFGEEPVAVGELDAIEVALALVLPKDLKIIAQFYSGGFLGGKSHHALASGGPATNVVDETLRLRSAIDLPHRFAVLAEPPASLIVLDAHSGIVTWCAAHDVDQLSDVSWMSSVPDTWQSYADYFEFLLDEEERERGGRT